MTEIPKENDDEMSAAKTFAKLTSNRFSVQDIGLEIIPDPVKENSDEGAAVPAVALGNEPVSEIKNPDYEDKLYDDRCPGYTKDEIDILALTVM
ncbi:MAG: hypothetical protein IJS94_08255, partial [Clostridia bacterium]|nr:hypothetical protein [Clostridia bacterium]